MKLTPTNYLLFIVMIGLAMLVVTACLGQPAAPLPSQDDPALAKKSYKDLIVGYAQLGDESEWRTANTNSIKKEAERLGVELMFLDAQQKQENQIKAVRAFIAHQVDVIGISPIVETGWEAVFQEAKDAGIPIILVDRRADVPEDLYVTYIGSDFAEEGEKSARVMVDLLAGQGKIVELMGTIDSAPAKGRYEGFRKVLADYPEMQIIASKPADFTQAKGKEVMEEFLQQYGADIDAVYAHNDDMAIGAISAIEAYGLKPGHDLKIVSIDAARIAFEAMRAGKLNATIECNPLLGPGFFDLVLKVVNNEPVPKWIKSDEDVFLPHQAAEIMPIREY